MAKAEAKFKMAKGLAQPEDIKYYEKMGWSIIKKGSLTEKELETLEIEIKVLNAKQLAIKVAGNSVAEDTPVPCKINGKFVYRTIGKLAKKGSWRDDGQGGELGEPIDGLEVWSDRGFTKCKYIFRHVREDQRMKRVNTHLGCVDVTEDHSLLNKRGKKVKASEVKIGGKLLHIDTPLPKDTPWEPLYVTISKETIIEHELGNSKYMDSDSGEMISEEKAFVWGLFFAEGTAGTSGTWGAIAKTKSSFVIYNQDRALLERAEKILNKEEDALFEISNWYESGQIYHLRAKSNDNEKSVKRVADLYRDLFYDERGRKRIPDTILRAPLKFRQAFFMGYYAGDGARHVKTGVIVTNKGSLGTAQLCYLARSLGYIVSVSYSKTNVYRLQCCVKFRNSHPDAIKTIRDSPEIEPERNIRKPQVRNGSKIEVIDGVCKYKGIKIYCERIPRQKLLDSLDLAQTEIKDRGTIVEYSTKTKKLKYECPICKELFTMQLKSVHAAKTARHDKNCDCENKESPEHEDYVEKDYVDYVEYVYDIETESHHFAAGVGAMIVHNSAYGTLGAQNGPIPLIEGAESVTGIGRLLIMDAIEYILRKNPGAAVVGEKGEPLGKAKLVYGDSVTPDTPILIKFMSGKKEIINYVNIEDIPRKSPWLVFGEKEYSFPRDDVFVWSDQGFTKIKEIMRHKTEKNIYRVSTPTGSVDVTEDHSLLLPNGREIRPVDVDIGDALLHSDLPPSLGNNDKKICSYSMGFFFGSNKNPLSWKIESHIKENLKKVKAELEDNYPFTFSIKTNLRRNLRRKKYVLKPDKDNFQDNFQDEWNTAFYTHKNQKKVPEEIINGTKEEQELFLKGYRDSNNDLFVPIKGALASAGLFYIYEQLGYSTCFITNNNFEFASKIVRSKTCRILKGNEIVDIINQGPSNDYVYDLETENHHFAAGVGKMIVHNTDSSMMTFVGKSTEESFLLGDKISKETTHYLKTKLLDLDEEYSILCPSENVSYRIDKYPRNKMDELDDELKIQIYEYDSNPINLQFENLYKRYLLLSKKRYLATAVNRKGEIVAKIKKGVVLARRDNCQYLRDSYSKMVDAIIERSTETDVMNILYDQVHKLFTRQIPDAHLIIYMGVKTIMNYAKRKETKTRTDCDK